MTAQADSALFVMTNVPSLPIAQQLAATLVNAHLAACVNILGACQSVYRWQGQVEQTTEIPLLIKTTQSQYAALQAAILAEHPYELPEIIALNINEGYAPYLQWLQNKS